MPIGPINMVCIKQTIRLGLSGFLIVAMASGIANVVLSGLAATGSVAIVQYLTHYQKALHVFGGVVLIGFGVRELVKGKSEYQIVDSPDLKRLFLQVISIAFSNPMTILGYMSLMIELAGNTAQAGMILSVVAGLTLASVVWRVCLGSLVLGSGVHWFWTTYVICVLFVHSAFFTSVCRQFFVFSDQTD